MANANTLAIAVQESAPDISAGHPQRIASIDGLRAVAILLVILNHFTPWVVTSRGPLSVLAVEASHWAGSGVDLFFVLSGFLITGILVDSRHSENYFARFYWRRSMRIFPAYYAFLLPTFFLFPGLFSVISRPWFLFYLRNWRGPDSASDSALGHLWSLAVEEQFYIAWSIAVFLVATRWLPHLAVALTALAPVVRAVMSHLGYSAYQIIRVTPARMDSLLLGALVALAVRSAWKSKLSAMARTALLMAVVGLSLLRLITGPLDIGNVIVQVVYPFLMPLLYASALALSLELTAPIHPFLRIVAKYSYAIYLFHLLCGRLTFALFQLAGERFPAIAALLDALFIPVAFAIVFGVAALSWRWIEAPALRLKDRIL